MNTHKMLPSILLMLVVGVGFAAESPQKLPLLDSLMSKSEQEKTGVSKLSPKERAALEEWLTGFAVKVATKVASDSSAAPRSGSYANVGQKHWVKSKADGGAFITLEDGSLWQISPIDKINTALWLPTENVVLVESKNPQYPFKLVGERNSAEAKLVAAAGAAAGGASPDGEIDLYDSTGSAVVYIAPDSEMTIYLWSGKPCAYLNDEDIYGFNGKHLGWFRSGLVYDHDGYVVSAVANAFRSPVERAPLKSLKELRPLKGLKELKPLKPLWSKEWSRTPAKVFIVRGANSR